MKISRKITLLHIFFACCFMVGILVMSHFVWEYSYLKLEQTNVRENTARAYLAWESELEILESIVNDWAPWDETYFFTQSPENSEFIEKNLYDASMANLKVNAIIIADHQGNIIFSKAFDLEKNNEIPIQPGLVANIPKLLNTHKAKLDEGQCIKGYVGLSDYPVLFAAEKIQTSDFKGDSPGVLIFAKYANVSLLNELSKKTQIDISLAAAKGELEVAQGKEFFQQAVNRNFIKGYYLLQDTYSNSNYYLVSTVPRAIYNQGLFQIKNFMIFTILFSLVFVLGTFFILNKLVLTRIYKIDEFMNMIVKKGDYSLRVNLAGNDELSKVAETINGMLNKIQRSQSEIKYLYNNVQKELEDRKKAEQELRFLSMHDPLTGLYNRNYFEQELKQVITQNVCRIGIVSCDLDGLKLINDTMGHSAGDQLLIDAAQLLQEAFKDKGIVARVGGDEFAVLLSNINEEDIKKPCRWIKSRLEIQDQTMMGLSLKLSLGWKYYAGEQMSEEILRNLVKQADDLMYRHKLSSSYSNRNVLVQGMLELLKVRDFITEGHSQRLQEHVIALGEAVGLEQSRIDDLRLLAQFHDIGKVGIPDNILFKPSRLSEEERKEMERHSEIGHRIAKAIPELMPIADLILKHHEWWDGSGYPLGLDGDQIPIEDRILAIVDAYDAMTNNRPYRKAMSTEKAINELKLNAGKQFDPELVECFIKIFAISE